MITFPLCPGDPTTLSVSFFFSRKEIVESCASLKPEVSLAPPLRPIGPVSSLMPMEVLLPTPPFVGERCYHVPFLGAGGHLKHLPQGRGTEQRRFLFKSACGPVDGTRRVSFPSSRVPPARGGFPSWVKGAPFWPWRLTPPARSHHSTVNPPLLRPAPLGGGNPPPPVPGTSEVRPTTSPNPGDPAAWRTLGGGFFPKWFGPYPPVPSSDAGECPGLSSPFSREGLFFFFPTPTVSIFEKSPGNTNVGFSRFEAGLPTFDVLVRHCGFPSPGELLTVLPPLAAYPLRV